MSEAGARCTLTHRVGLSRSPLATVLAALCISSCSGEAPDAAVAVSDSAGIAVVVSGESAGTMVIEVDSAPQLRLGAVEGEELYRVGGATRLADGTIVVLDGGSREVRWFDEAGIRIATAGRRGEGPGEFDRFRGLSRIRGDSLLVFDNWLRRATIYDRAGSLGRVLTLPLDMQAEGLVPLGEDQLLALTWSLDAFMELEGPYRSPYTGVVLSIEGAVRDTVFSVPGPAGYKVVRGDGNYSDFSPLIIENGYLASGGGQIVYGSAEEWEIRRMDASGGVTHIMRAPSLNRPFSTAEVERERQAMLRPESSAEYRSLVAQLQPPEQWPAYSDLLMGANGWVWAAEYRSMRTEADAPTRWIVFDEAGAWRGVAVTPARFRLFEVGEGFVLGVRLDDLDVEQVQLLEWRVRDPE